MNDPVIIIGAFVAGLLLVMMLQLLMMRSVKKSTQQAGTRTSPTKETAYTTVSMWLADADEVPMTQQHRVRLRVQDMSLNGIELNEPVVFDVPADSDIEYAALVFPGGMKLVCSVASPVSFKADGTYTLADLKIKYV